MARTKLMRDSALISQDSWGVKSVSLFRLICANFMPWIYVMKLKAR